MQKIKIPKIKNAKTNIPKHKKPNIFYKTFGWLNNKIILRFIPFSQKKGISIKLRLYVIIITIFIFVSGVSISTYLLTSRTVLIKNIDSARNQYENRSKELSKLKSSLNDLLLQIDYNDITTNIFTKANLIKSDMDIFSTNVNMNDIEYISEISNIIKNIDISQVYIDKIVEDINKKELSYLKIANILPIENDLIISVATYQRINENGIHIEALPSTPIRSTAEATIKSIKYNNDEGYEVVLEHSFNVVATYKGLSSLTITIDDKKIDKNQIIGYLAGSRFANNILEYKIKFANTYINPLLVTIN